MKHILITVLIFVAAILPLSVAARVTRPYYGTNYTVPFAHAYRALDHLGVDHREAIDRDVYHMARLGFNGFRLHLWDVELSDASGNLLENEHLDLLDYLISKLEERGIDIILTAQTNFGNGYPERNSDPNGAFSYDFEKCRVHDDPAAQAIQERYLAALVKHVNPYSGKSFAEDNNIIAIEINNEPCHSGTHSEITNYVNRMSEAIRKAGWKKDVLYNVSHNLWRTSAFYNADIDGTTYQWYPTGLVHGSRRKGNFLPVLDSYDIPFDTVAGYTSQPKYIYEYDPGDVLDTYLYPAAARTFRKAGFDWVTQFAYDPIDMARFNTEYQTHFLNLAYTPGKAIGMAIAAEVMRRTNIGMDFGKYPADTIFGDFTVSARRDLAMLNDGKYYYHTNSTTDKPKNLSSLRRVAGVGSSPVVRTDGSGAYFIDRLDKNVWRLEVMPDVILTADPFTRPSLSRKVGEIIDAPVTLEIRLDGLSEGFAFSGERSSGTADGYKITVMPGVYLMSRNAENFVKWPSDKVYDKESSLKVGEFVMPPVDTMSLTLIHRPAPRVSAGEALRIEATVIPGADGVDSVMVYPASVDFWRDRNRTYRMKNEGKYTYSCVVEAPETGEYSYSIVVFSDGQAMTYPANECGTPLDWDFGAGRERAIGQVYTTRVSSAAEPIILLDTSKGLDGAEFSSIPESWHNLGMNYHDASPVGNSALRIFRGSDAAPVETMIVTKYVGDLMASHGDAIHRKARLRFGDTTGLDSINVGFVTRDGFTYAARLHPEAGSTIDLDLASLALVPTLLTPAPYPSFLARRFVPDTSTATPFEVSEIESVVFYTEGVETPFATDIVGLWLE